MRNAQTPLRRTIVEMAWGVLDRHIKNKDKESQKIVHHNINSVSYFNNNNNNNIFYLNFFKKTFFLIIGWLIAKFFQIWSTVAGYGELRVCF